MNRGSKGSQGVRRSARKSTFQGKPSIYSTPSSLLTEDIASGSEKEQVVSRSSEEEHRERGVPDLEFVVPEDLTNTEVEDVHSEGELQGLMA